MTGRLRLYPNRKRCLACRSYFGFIVVDGLFCSYRCAGIPKPNGKTPYRCSYCLGWHIGTPAPGKRYPADLIKVGRS